jgi:hypothetical protein
MVASRTPVLLCIEDLKCIINHMDVDKCLINDVQGKCVGVFMLVEVNKYYKLKEPEVKLNVDFVDKFYERHNANKLLASWWKEDKKIVNRTTRWYSTINLIEAYMYLMALICRLYGDKDCSRFFEAWMPIAYNVAVSGSTFNWRAIISKQLSTRIEQAQNPNLGDVPSFYMASYSLDVICARNIFSRMGLSWHVSELPIQYFSALWENTYKNSYVMICDEFLARLHFIIFKQECPRL